MARRVRLLVLLTILAGAASAGDLAPRPVVPSVSMETGALHAIAFRLDEPVAGGVVFEASSDDPSVVAVQGPLEFLPGERLAFLFCRGGGPGRAEVRAGGARCEVEVRPDRTPPAVLVLTPAPGAAVWGRVRAVARVWDANGARLEWRVDGRVVETSAGVGDLEVDLPAPGAGGRAVLSVRAVDPAGNEATDERPILLLGEGGDVRAVEAEEATPKGAVYGFEPQAAPVEVEPEAGGGRVAVQYATVQVVQPSIDVAEAGWYQVVVAARGDRYLADPSLAIFVDDSTTTVGAGPVTSSGRIGRFAIGAPFRLEAGARRLSIVFYNDAYDPETGLDRNCRIDRVEIRRVGRERPDVVAPTTSLLLPRSGEVVGGPFAVAALAFDDDRVAELRLVVDGREVARAGGERMVHWMDGDDLSPGRHEIEVVAVDPAGNEGPSHAIEVERLPYDGPSPALAVLEWRDGRSASLEATPDATAPGGGSWGLYSGGVDVRFDVDVPRAGEYEVTLLARADLHEGAPTARVSVGAGREFRVDVASRYWDESAPGRLRLERGRNEIAIEFVNDRYDGTPETDRNLHVAGLVARERGRDRTPPRVEVVWPPEGAQVRGTEMVVVRVSDNGEVARLDLLAGDRIVSTSGASGLTGLWLHEGASGPLAIRVRAVDREGNEARTDPRLVFAAPADPVRLSPTERAIHLLSRAGFGASVREVASLLAGGEAAWLERQLAPLPAEGDPADRLFAPLLRDNAFNVAALQIAILVREVLTERVLRERTALFLDNHFSTWSGKTDAWREWIEHEAFRRRAHGPFRDLVASSLVSPAMIAYLDNDRNRKGAINENLGRELLELHTLGVDGGYAQRDVEEVSRILTGWTATLGFPWFQFAISDAHHDAGPKTILGTRFPGEPVAAEGERLLAVLAAHPASARFVAGKLVRWLVADDPPPGLVDAVAARFLASGGDLGAVLREILRSPASFERRRYGTKTKDPVELVAGFHRHPVNAYDFLGMLEWTAKLGQPLFGCATPDGYPEDGWLHSGSMLGRWNFAEVAAARLAVRTVVGAPGGRDLDRLSADLAMTLLARPLSGPEREVVRQAFEGADPDDDGTVHALAALVLQMPAAQRN